MARTTARTAVMQMIYERIAGGQGGEETLRMVYDQLREEENPDVRPIEADEPGQKDRAWISRVLNGVLEQKDELDERIGKASKGWTVDRMPLVDLTIMRLAAWEILNESDEDVPDSVAISEALTLAEKYSDPAGKSFINGVLGTIAREKEQKG